jgi:hypothetical protein
MAKGLPYFKFTPTEWMTGDICFESFEIQGLFINICALYWQRDGNLSLEDINKRYKEPTALDSLIGRFISVNDGLIGISFLDEQFIDRNHISKTNSLNGSKGGRPKTLGKKPNAKRTKTETKANESQEEEEQEEEINKNKINLFEDFWNLYDKKVGDKEKIKAKFIKLKDSEIELIFLHVPKYKIAQPDKKYRKDPSTYLNNKSWNDEVVGLKQEEPKPNYDPNLPAPQHNRILV